MLRIESLHKSYGQTAVLRGIDLEIERGEITALLGPNGAGKTTLVSIATGLRRPNSGAVSVGGVDVLRRPEQARSLMGVAPQTLGVYPTLTARQNLRFFGELAGLARRIVADRIDEVSTALDLTSVLDRRVAVLSGGQQRRLHTAAAMLHEPPLLFLDEPTVGADIESRRQILALVKSLATRGCAVCYATHFLPEIDELAATVAVLHAGTIVARGSAAELAGAYGQAGLRLTFRGAAPPIEGCSVDGVEAFRQTTDPGRELAGILATSQEWLPRLDGVEIVRPDLETAYLALTRRDESDTPTEEAAHVV